MKLIIYYDVRKLIIKKKCNLIKNLYLTYSDNH